MSKRKKNEIISGIILGLIMIAMGVEAIAYDWMIGLVLYAPMYLVPGIVVLCIHIKMIFSEEEA